MIPESLSNLRSSDLVKETFVICECLEKLPLMWRQSLACFVLSLGGLKMGRLALEPNFSFGNSLAERWSVKVYQKCACRESGFPTPSL